MDGVTSPATLVKPLRVGRFVVPTPVVLAPMAGVTNQAFRRLCREEMATAGGRGLFSRRWSPAARCWNGTPRACG